MFMSREVFMEPWPESKKTLTREQKDQLTRKSKRISIWSKMFQRNITSTERCCLASSSWLERDVWDAFHSVKDSQLWLSSRPIIGNVFNCTNLEQVSAYKMEIWAILHTLWDYAQHTITVRTMLSYCKSLEDIIGFALVCKMCEIYSSNKFLQAMLQSITSGMDWATNQCHCSYWILIKQELYLFSQQSTKIIPCSGSQ